MTEPERIVLRGLIDERRRALVGSPADGIMHGTEMAYRKNKCRCDECRAHATATRRAHRAAHPEQAREACRRYKRRRRARTAA